LAADPAGAAAGRNDIADLGDDDDDEYDNTRDCDDYDDYIADRCWREVKISRLHSVTCITA
jgi:hypothetical protein